MTWQTSSTSSGDTERLGELLGKHLKGGEVIELRSDLGGGKTTFARGLAKGAGSSGRVASPTFTLNRIYKTKDLQIHHFDFYRLDDPGVLSDQLAESLGDPKVTTLVEWADIVKDVLPAGHLTVEFIAVRNNPDERLINFSYPESDIEMISRIETAWQDSRP